MTASEEHGPLAWMAKNRIASNVLMLIDAVNRNRDAGMTPTDALIKGCTRRFRPIVIAHTERFFAQLRERPTLIPPQIRDLAREAVE